jgi:hypothetical protein
MPISIRGAWIEPEPIASIKPNSVTVAWAPFHHRLAGLTAGRAGAGQQFMGQTS